jgi:hypothetical protein
MYSEKDYPKYILGLVNLHMEGTDMWNKGTIMTGLNNAVTNLVTAGTVTVSMTGVGLRRCKGLTTAGKEV